MSAVAPREALLAVQDLTKRYGPLEVLKNLSFELGRGEFLTLLGPSGCGKSTTLMTIAGFERPDAGTITLDGRSINDDAPERRGMGVVFQNYALFPHMTVLDNVKFPLHMRDMPDREALTRAREALALVQLVDVGHHFPTQISGGQMQRVALARAIVFEPAILLMDEPLSALDRRLRQELQFELRHIQHRLGTTVLYVTHDQEEALVLSDRIAVMRGGTFEQVGTPREVYDAPASSFVAGFLGESNRIMVDVLANRDRVFIVSPVDDPAYRFSVPAARDVPDRALLVLRPEHLRLAASDEEPPPGFDSCLATVVDLAFLGDHLRVEVEALDGQSWTIRASPRDNSAAVNARQGTKVRLLWRQADAHLVAP